MNIRKTKNPTAIMAGITGLLFTIVYGVIELSSSFPTKISFTGEANSLSVFHYPVIWILAGILFYCVFRAVGIIRTGKIKERVRTFSICAVVAALLTLYWLLPMLVWLYEERIKLFYNVS
jgi:uncharacterized membrane protein